MFLNPWKRMLYEKPLFGSFVTFASPEITELIANLGFDFLVFDNEHATMDDMVIENMLRASQVAGTPAIVRIPCNRSEYIRKALDSGANGVQIPMVSTAQEVLKVIEPANFPPLGERGVAFFTRAGRYGLIDDAKTYLEQANESKLLAIHIETPEAVRNLDEMLAVEGIDVYFVGPVDLACSMGYAHELNHPEVWKTVKLCIEKIKSKGKIAGTFTTDINKTHQVIDWGATYILTAINQYITEGAGRYLEGVRKK